MVVHSISESSESFASVANGVLLIRTFCTLEEVEDIFGVAVDMAFDLPFGAVVCWEGGTFLDI